VRHERGESATDREALVERAVAQGVGRLRERGTRGSRVCLLETRILAKPLRSVQHRATVLAVLCIVRSLAQAALGSKLASEPAMLARGPSGTFPSVSMVADSCWHRRQRDANRDRVAGGAS
jgi:hypothetical protein